MEKENVLCGRFVLRGLLAVQRQTSSWHCIWLAEDKNAGPEGKSDVVVKKYNLDAQHKQEDFHDLAHHITNEVVLMHQFRHPNLLPCITSFVHDAEIFVVSPMSSLGSVRDVLDVHFPSGLPEQAVALVLRDVLRALEYLHGKKVVHRSVRASHILLSSSGSARLSGLRYACHLTEPGQTGLQDRYDYDLHVAKSNLCWLSPEFLQQNLLGYNEKTDIYSLGVTACEMANGIVPYSEMPSTLMLLEKLRGAAPKLIDATTLTETGSDEHVGNGNTGNHVAPSGKAAESSSVYAQRQFSDAFHGFVGDCSLLDASSRPSATKLLSSPFIKQYKKSGAELAALLSALSLPVHPVNAHEDDLEGDFSAMDVSEDWVF